MRLHRGRRRSSESVTRVVKKGEEWTGDSGRVGQRASFDA